MTQVLELGDMHFYMVIFTCIIYIKNRVQRKKEPDVQLPEMKIIRSEVKDTLEHFEGRLGITKEKIIELEYPAMKYIQNETTK